MSKLIEDFEKLIEDYNNLKQACETVRRELYALLPLPAKPDWMPALTAGNKADAACLDKALDAVEAALLETGEL